MARWLALALVVVLAFATPAQADVRSKRDRGGARAGAALDIARVTAVGSADGLIVSVRMKGNFELAARRRRLRRAVVALILRPRSRRRRASILATTGSSRRPKNLLRTRSRRVGVARIGRTLHFVIRGGGLASVRRIQVKTFKRLPRRQRARKSDDIRITPEQARTILGEDGADGASIGAPSTDTSCRDLLETARGAEEALKNLSDYVRRLNRTGAPRAELGNARGALDAVRGLSRSALLELARKCGTGAEVLCSGYRHLSADKSRVSATFGFTDVFGAQLNIGNFKFEYLNPQTGQYEPVRQRAGDEQRIIVSGGGAVIRAQSDIHVAGSYRITATVGLLDPEKPDNSFAVVFEQKTVAFVDVLPPAAGVTGGACPPDP